MPSDFYSSHFLITLVLKDQDNQTSISRAVLLPEDKDSLVLNSIARVLNTMLDSYLSENFDCFRKDRNQSTFIQDVQKWGPLKFEFI